ncbi:MAG: tRNA (adenosine(37)-N6)-threonylcarbamoyltransferase complex ATPase subunit type 1 TsaE [Brevinemataceae bacterium]
MNFDLKFQIDSLDDLEKFCVFISQSEFSKIFVLNGELGAGKTTFVKTFIDLFDSEILVNSPTFTLMNIYQGSNFQAYHFDLYRLSTVDEALELGFDEFFNEKCWIFIEWADKVISLIPKPFIIIDIHYLSEVHQRMIYVRYIS